MRLSDLRYCPACAGALELRDFDDDGLHPACAGCGFVLWQNLRPCVDALVVRGQAMDAEILLGRRAIEPCKGMWDTPGGFLNARDKPEDRLVRACLAEVGIIIRVRELLGAFTDLFGNIPIITLYYMCDAEPADPQPGQVVDRVQWFPIAAPPPLAFSGGEGALRVLRDRLDDAGAQRRSLDQLRW